MRFRWTILDSIIPPPPPTPCISRELRWWRKEAITAAHWWRQHSIHYSSHSYKIRFYLLRKASSKGGGIVDTPIPSRHISYGYSIWSDKCLDKSIIYLMKKRMNGTFLHIRTRHLLRHHIRQLVYSEFVEFLHRDEVQLNLGLSTCGRSKLMKAQRLVKKWIQNRNFYHTNTKYIYKHLCQKTSSLISYVSTIRRCPKVKR